MFISYYLNENALKCLSLNVYADVANGIAINVVNEVLPVKWMQKSLLHAVTIQYAYNTIDDVGI